MPSSRPAPSELLVEPGSRPGLAKSPTGPQQPPARGAARDELAATVSQIAALQERLYAQGSHSVLVVFQAMDAAGKDSTIAKVMSGINPQGCRVTSFKQPSAEELAHDFLWRATRALPPRGVIGVFNRSHYEETLVVRVHPDLLAPQRLPGNPHKPKELGRLWEQRYEAINAFERHLDRSGTRIVKLFLHVSREEQRNRLLARIDDPAKHWKFEPEDVDERTRWDDYLAAYEDTIAATSTSWAPWHVIPADDKPTMRQLVADVLLATMQGLDLRLPETTAAEQEVMDAARVRLLADD